MTINKLDIGVVERIAPSTGPTSSSDYNATNQETINALSQITLQWNDEIYPLLDSLPSGLLNIIREERTTQVNPFVNGFDGSQIYLDSTSTTLTDDGKYFDDVLSRPTTVKESLEGVQEQLNDAIQELEVKIAQISQDSGITPRQRQAIGSRIFDSETTSGPNSLDGLTQSLVRNVDQVALDISGDSEYLNNNGAQTLQYHILSQIKALQDAHDYNAIFNIASHEHLVQHEHRCHKTPVGLLNGVNKIYYLPGTDSAMTGSMKIIVNGQEKQIIKDYTEHPDGRGFTFTVAHRALENDGSGADDNLWCHYDLEI